MKKFPFPWVATGIGLTVAMALLRIGALNPNVEPALPLLTMLFMAEFGFLVSLAGAVSGARTWFAQRDNFILLGLVLACVVLAGGLFWAGLSIWRNSVMS